MVNVGKLLVGVVLFIPPMWAMLNPQKDFAIAKKFGFIGVENSENLELDDVGVLRNMVGYGIVALFGLYLAITAVV